MPHHDRSWRPHQHLGMALLCLALALPVEAHGAAVRQVTPPRPSRPCYTPPAPPTAITLSGVPDALAIATRACRAFVRNLDGSVNVLDLTQGTLLRTVQVSSQPGGIDFAPAVAVDDRTQRVFVVNSGDSTHNGSLSVLDAASEAVVRTVSTGVYPSSVAIDSQRGRVFVTNTGSSNMSILDAASGAVLRTIPVEGATVVAVDARRARVFVAGGPGEHGVVSTLDESTGRVLRTAPIAGIPAVLVEDPQSGHVFVGPTSEGGAFAGRLSLLDATTGAVLRSIDLLRAPPMAMPALDVHGLAVDARTGHVFVAWTGTYQGEPAASGVSMLDAASGALLKRIAVGVFPTAVVVDEQRGHTFVTHRDIINSDGDPRGNGSLSVLDTASGRVVDTKPVGWGPTGMALDAPTGLLLVANQSIQGTDQGTISIVRARPRHALPTDPVPPAHGARYFPHSHHNFGGPFLAFWQRYGGLATFGEPRTEPFHERGSLVQYTDRFELERVGGQVDTFRLGYMLTSQRTIPRVAPVASTRTRLYFADTGHTLSGRFLAYWRTHHGATLLGAPLSEVIMEGNGDGSGRRYPLQWFEKGRLEYHPELAGTRYALELGLLGVQVLQQRGWLP